VFSGLVAKLDIATTAMLWVALAAMTQAPSSDNGMPFMAILAGIFLPRQLAAWTFVKRPRIAALGIILTLPLVVWLLYSIFVDAERPDYFPWGLAFAAIYVSTGLYAGAWLIRDVTRPKALRA
jgi:hypothetical protein